MRMRLDREDRIERKVCRENISTSKARYLLKKMIKIAYVTLQRVTVMKSTSFGTVFVRVFMFILGLMVALPALNTLSTYCNYRFLGSMTYGVIDHPSSGRDFGGRPLIQYVDMAGSSHEFKSRAKTHVFQTPKKGEKIKIFIHKSDPQKAIVDSLFYYVLLPLIFLAAGCYCCLSSLFGRKSMSPLNTVVSSEFK